MDTIDSFLDEKIEAENTRHEKMFKQQVSNIRK
jgi:hypothetical protein